MKVTIGISKLSIGIYVIEVIDAKSKTDETKFIKN